MLQIRTSDRNTFKNCRQKWDFSSPLRGNWEPDIPPKPLWLGSACHHAWEVYYDPTTPRDAAVAIAAYVLYCTTRLAQYEVEQGEMWTEQKEGWEQQFQLGLAMLQYYFSEAEALDDFEVIWVEKDILVCLEDLRDSDDADQVYYGARLDGLVKDNHGEYWILEHKTAASLPSNTEYLEKDDQCGSYIWLVQEELGIPVAGVLYNVMVKKVPHPPAVLKNGGLSKNKQADTTLKLYKEAMAEHKLAYSQADYDYMEFLEEFPKKFIYREKVRRNQFEVASMRKRITDEAHDMLANPLIYPTPNQRNCTGCWFLEPCTAKLEGQDVQFVLDSEYKQRPNYDETITDKETAW